MFDGTDETYWSSDQVCSFFFMKFLLLMLEILKGTPQFITLDFESPVEFKAVKIQFQGGFAGKDCSMIVTKATGEEIKEPFYPEDVNKTQTFALKERETNVKSVRLAFDSSFDFFGRIVIYSLEVMR